MYFVHKLPLLIERLRDHNQFVANFSSKSKQRGKQTERGMDERHFERVGGILRGLEKRKQQFIKCWPENKVSSKGILS